MYYILVIGHIWVNTPAIPILICLIGGVKWSETEPGAGNILTPLHCYKHRIHHIHAAVETFAVSRIDEKNVFIDIRRVNYTQIEILGKYFMEKVQANNLHGAIVLVSSITYTIQWREQ